MMRHRPGLTHITPRTRLLSLAAALPLASGCAEVAVWGNVFSMLLTLAIFLGTLSLSREGGRRRGRLG